MQRCCTPLAIASARGRAVLPSGEIPCRLAASPCAATWLASPPTGKVPAGDRHCGWAPRCRSPLLRAQCCRRLPLQVVAL
ncbi:hypothetical protein B296_00035425 [Ensete ventricosum]|uniref:Uncharacterized protein n=1 Tax=Ensete ventricosum TaxID=4639 RepID=A0A426X022_ENSVE|nr:hypothetical protein B296_00035425 [Ensete ventricosum]